MGPVEPTRGNERRTPAYAAARHFVQKVTIWHGVRKASTSHTHFQSFGPGANCCSSPALSRAQEGLAMNIATRPTSSRISGFHKMSPQERLSLVESFAGL